MKSPSSNIAAVAAVVLMMLSVTASAESARSASSMASGVTELEKGFWVCDHAATTQKVDLNVAATCGTITDELRRVKFGGNFERMLEWWQLNKAAQHAALDHDNTARASTESTDMVEHPDSI